MTGTAKKRTARKATKKTAKRATPSKPTNAPRQLDGLQIYDLPLDRIEPHPKNPRRQPTREELKELAASITAVGVMQPITVRPHDGNGYQIVFGERRYRATKQARLKTIPCMVRELDDKQTIEMLSVENDQRENLTPIEEATGIQNMLDLGWTHAEIANRNGRSRQWVARRANLLALSPKWRGVLAGDETVIEALDEGADCDDEQVQRIQAWPPGHLEAIARLPAAAQNEILSSMLADYDDWTRDELNRTIQQAMLSLDGVPWDLDEDLSEECLKLPICSKCLNRTAAQPDLWETDETKNDYCLDPNCYRAKMRIWLVRRRLALEAQHGVLQLLKNHPVYAANEVRDNPMISSASWRNHHDVAKTPNKNCKPAMMVDGPNAGELIWLKPSESGENAGTDAPPSVNGGENRLAEREAKLKKRRQLRATALFFERIEEIRTSDDEMADLLELIPLEDMLAWIYAYGIEDSHGYDNEKGTFIHSPEVWRDERKRPRQCLLRNLLSRVFDRMRKRTNTHDGEEAQASLADWCELLRMDVDDFLNQATEDIPEPRSWAAERAAMEAR